MFDKQYMSKHQSIINYWKDRFDILYDWEIVFTFDENRWCQMDYDLQLKKARIFICDVEEPSSYLLNKVITLAFIASNTIEKQRELIKDIVSAIQEDK